MYTLIYVKQITRTYCIAQGNSTQQFVIIYKGKECEEEYVCVCVCVCVCVVESLCCTPETNTT